MHINQDEAALILRLVAIADHESLADVDDMRLAIRVMQEFPSTCISQGFDRQRYEERIAAPPPEPPTPRPVAQLDLSLAASVPELGWQTGVGQKDNPFLDPRD